MAEVIVVHGYAGSGKTTHCERLAEEGLDGKSVGHVSAGNRLRAIRANECASQFSQIINSPYAPSPIPDNVMNGVIFEALEEESNKDLLLVDGFQRLARTVPLFHDSLRDNDYELLGTVFLHIPRKLSIDRVVAREQRAGEILKGDDLRSDTESRYNRDAQRVRRATAALGRISLVEVIDASGDEETVYSAFTSAIGRLALSNYKASV